MTDKPPTNPTLRRMQRKLQADKEAANYQQWIKRHPHSPEARSTAAKASQAALAKFHRTMEAQKRHDARAARKLTNANRITAEWLRSAFVVNPASPGGLQLKAGNHDANLTVSIGRWKITRGSPPHMKSMSATQALTILSPETHPPRKKCLAEKKAKAEQQKRYRAKKAKS
jgi:hypothetical protein